MKTNKSILLIIFLISHSFAITSHSQSQQQNINLSCPEAQFVQLINLYRRMYRLTPIKVPMSGVKAARWHAADMIKNDYFSHTEPNGRTFNQRASVFGYPSHSENIAAGNALASKTFCQWKLSPGHNRNMLGRHDSMGIDLAAGGGRYKNYWNNTFGPKVNDILSEPLVKTVVCPLPNSLPICK